MRGHKFILFSAWEGPRPTVLSRLMGDTLRTESFHLLLKIVLTAEKQLFMRKTLSKNSPLEMGLHEHNGALY